MKKLIALLLFPLLFPFAGCAGVFMAAPIEVRVVDKDTKQPVEGVIAVAHWGLKEKTWHGGKTIGHLMIMETVTDKEGRFKFPAWGPAVGEAAQFMKGTDPHIALFKMGYVPQVLGNQLDMNKLEVNYSTSIWNGKTITMETRKDNWEKYFQAQFSLGSKLRAIILDAQVCEWKRMPRLLTALERERRQLIEQGIKDSNSMFGLANIVRNPGCESVEGFFSEYLK